MRLASKLLFALLLLLSSGFCQRANSQTNPERKAATATISGKVTIKGKPARGVLVSVRLNQENPSPRTFQGKTDDDGSYHVTGVPSGSVTVVPVAPAFVNGKSSESWGKSLIVSDGDTIEGIDFDLLKGGVITGKVTNADGSPVIAQRVSLLRVDGNRTGGSYAFQDMFETDDRGIYRMFGVAPGRYKVSVSDQRLASATVRGRSIPETYHPNTTDATKAAIVEIDEGTEATQVDITVSRSSEGFTVTGQVIDQDTNNPISNAAINLMRITVIDANRTNGSGGPTDVRTDASGAFHLDQVPPGTYDISAEPPPNTSLIVEPIRFDVVDADVSGLVIKTSAGASVSGTVVLEGVAPEFAAKPLRFWVAVDLRNEVRGYGANHSGDVKADGTFSAGGLSPGVLRFSAGVWGPTGNSRRLTIARIERDGAAQPNAITIEGAEQIRGIRIVLTNSSGTIRGLVRIVNGTLSPEGRLFADIKASNDPDSHGTQVDARGHFLIENVGPGTYELGVHYNDNVLHKFVVARQSVTVTAGETSEVVITLDLADRGKP